MKRLWPLPTAAVSPSDPANPVRSGADVERRSFAVEPGGLLAADVEWGAIEVRTWDRPMAELVLEGARKLDLSYGREGNRTTVHVSREDAGSSVLSRIFGSAPRNPGAKLRLVVPRRHDLELTTAGGSIGLGELQGRVRVRTAGGDFSCAHIEGPVDARTAGGEVRVEVLDGDVLARSSGGDVHLAWVRGAVQAWAGEGNLHFRLSHQPGEPCRLETSGGAVEVFLAADMGLQVDARTSGGRITTDFPLTFQGTLEKSSLKASVNGGGPLVTLCTGGGSIRLHKLHGVLP